MVGTFRRRRLAYVALLGALALGVAACGGEYPNTTFSHNTEYNTAIDALWDRLLYLGTAVFVLVELGLIYTVVKFRRKPGATGTPKQVHGNTALEIAWTAIPAVILIFVAVPTVRTIFKTQAKATPDALQVEVIGHQWWWEFRYPQYGITTANELYIPNGRTVNFSLKTQDVLHSFWIPQMGGKRDVISNKTNYLWFTPNSDLPSSAWNGFCAEFCGTSHANMKFRVYTVTPDEFASWTAHQKNPAVFPVAMADSARATTVSAVAPVPSRAGSRPIITPVSNPSVPQAEQREQPRAKASLSNQAPQTAPLPTTAAQPMAPVWAFPRDKLPAAVIPNVPVPAGLQYDDALLAQGDAKRGMDKYNRTMCIACHAIKGNPMSVAVVGPNLTHVATRWTIAGGLYPNDGAHLARWLKNAPHMKPGSLMPTLGKGETDPKTKMVMNVGALTDADIADIVAYLQALK